jgi:hypothetical protein
MNELTPPPLPPASPFTVLRGRCVQVETESLPNVSGGGFSAAGWGYSRVQTTAVRNSAFWLRTSEGRDCHVSVGTNPLPAMLPNHLVSVVLCGQAVCAVCNHVTNHKELYRPTQPHGPYQPAANGCMMPIVGALFGWTTFVFSVFSALALHGGLLSLVVSLGAGLTVFILCLRLPAPSPFRHNQALDQQVSNLLQMPLPGKTQPPPGA